jgi:hypothetical protein
MLSIYVSIYMRESRGSYLMKRTEAPLIVLFQLYSPTPLRFRLDYNGSKSKLNVMQPSRGRVQKEG